MQYSESPLGVGAVQISSDNINSHSLDGQHIGPQGLMVFHDYDVGVSWPARYIRIYW